MDQTIHLQLSATHDPFGARLRSEGHTLERSELLTLQLNLGKMCNLACHHCHVEAGPHRTEIMTWETMTQILDWIDLHPNSSLQTIDLTGGAPEMNPHFRPLVVELRKRGLHVLDRCNLTILQEPGQEDTAAFLAEHQVEIVASLPCYLEDNVDSQRGQGVYQESITVLNQLNTLGYGQPDSGLHLNLVYNPTGYNLPPDQVALEIDYKRELKERYNILFNRLFTITNMPIARFEHALKRDGVYDSYMTKLTEAYQSVNVENVMCRQLISVGWQGSAYDCDFNQMLLMPLNGLLGTEKVVETKSRKIWEYPLASLLGKQIQTGSHCFGCTAGNGSSCTGTL